MAEPNEDYYSWNDVEVRSVDGGGIDTAHMCNYCFCIVPSFHFPRHMETMHADKDTN